MNEISRFVTLLYGLLTFGGGLAGYIKTDSLMSFLTGALTGVVAIAATKVGEEKSSDAYLYVAGLTLVLAGFFFFRFIRSDYAFMPAGLMLLASITTFSIVGLSWLKDCKK